MIHLKISGKIHLFLAILALLLILSLAVIQNNLSGFRNIWGDYLDQAASRQALLLDLKSHFGYGGGIHNFKNYVLRGQEKHRARTDDHLQKVLDTIDHYQAIPNLAESEKKALVAIHNIASNYLSQVDNIARMHRDKLNSNAIDKTVKINDSPALEAFDVLKKEYERLTQSSSLAIEEGVEEASQTILIIFILVMVLSMSFGLLTRSLVLNKIQNLNQLVEKISQGNFSQHISVGKHPDEIDQLAMGVNSLAHNLVDLVRNLTLRAETLSAIITESLVVKNELKEDADTVSTMTNEAIQLNSAVDDDFSSLKNQIDLTATKFVDVSDKAARLSTSIDNISNATHQANENVSSATQTTGEMIANIGGINQGLEQVKGLVDTVSQVVHSMQESNEQVVVCCESASLDSDKANQNATNALATMEELSNSASAIDQVVELINNIAEQTNMLALNASIEAAGAGESGKGFAVVANEVKELAQQTGNATQTISQSIQEIQINTRQATEANRLVSDSIKHIAEANREINDLITEQNHTVQGITQSMSDVTDATQTVTDNTADLAQAADSVTQASEQANRSVQEITLQVGDAAGEAGSLAQLGQDSLLLVGKTKSIGNDIFEASANVQKNGIKTLNTVNLMNGSIHQTELLVDVIHETSSALLKSTDHIEIGTPVFDVSAVKLAHLGWLSKLEHVIRGRAQLKSDEVATGRDCAFGKWYYTEGESLFGDLDNFQELGRVHLTVHELAREVVTLANNFETHQQAMGVEISSQQPKLDSSDGHLMAFF
jgi:methyl-accepting chemotaxis protein